MLQPRQQPPSRPGVTGQQPPQLLPNGAAPGGQLRELPALAGVFVAREGRLTGRLAQRLAGVGGGEDMFETWMKRESDLVQATALAYAEREVLEASARAVQQASNDPAPCCWWLA